jgi:DNA polymerase-3 subunit gamma/tau
MAYQVLARKWRPKEFDSLVGQEAVVTALTHALADHRIAQAYLFSGIRGVGKTTAARLLAKALNCEKGLGQGPCNECRTCEEITAGADLDVLEIDAATYSKVEQVRELTESLQYGPSRDRYKVVVLDEVHRLSRQAFDALLKIVEEPPPRLVFIFATTELDAVPATILSRCQEFQFRRVPASLLEEHLAKICAAEQIRASPRALSLIARAAEGSVRDAVALLDQLATFGKDTVDEAAAARVVGALDLGQYQNLLAAVVDADTPTVVRIAGEVEAAGYDPRQVFAHFLAFCRDALHLALGGAAAGLDLPPEEAGELAALARRAGYENLLRLLGHLLASENLVRRSDAGALALEIAWLRAAELPRLVAVEELLAAAGGAAGAPTPPRAAPAPPAAGPTLRSAATRRTAPPTPDEASAPPPAPATAEPEAPPPAPPTPTREMPRATSGLERFQEELAVRRPILGAQLARARCEFVDGELRIALPAGDPFAAAQLGREQNRELLDTVVVAAFGAGARWRLIEGPVAPPTAGETAARHEQQRQAREEVAGDPQVQALLDIFGGSVAAVRDDDGGPPRAGENG